MISVIERWVNQGKLFTTMAISTTPITIRENECPPRANDQLRIPAELAEVSIV